MEHIRWPLRIARKPHEPEPASRFPAKRCPCDSLPPKTNASATYTKNAIRRTEFGYTRILQVTVIQKDTRPYMLFHRLN
jgi:hypothetical protein